MVNVWSTPEEYIISIYDEWIDFHIYDDKYDKIIFIFEIKLTWKKRTTKECLEIFADFLRWVLRIFYKRENKISKERV